MSEKVESKQNTNIKKLKRLQMICTFVPILIWILLFIVDIYIYKNADNKDLKSFIIFNIMDFIISLIFAFVIYFKFKNFIQSKENM